MIQQAKPRIIVFDVNETLLDITILEPLFSKVFGNAGILREWFAELILYSQTLTLSGLYVPFPELAESVFQMVGANYEAEITNADITSLKAHLGQMPAHDDVLPALSLLRDAGYKLVTLTNSASAKSPTPLEQAGISDFFDRQFTVETAQKFKPHPTTYNMVANQMRVGPSELFLVACHLWDIIGAQAAGCQGAFITRSHNNLLPTSQIPKPDIIAENLLDFTEQFVQGEDNEP